MPNFDLTAWEDERDERQEEIEMMDREFKHWPVQDGEPC